MQGCQRAQGHVSGASILNLWVGPSGHARKLTGQRDADDDVTEVVHLGMLISK